MVPKNGLVEDNIVLCFVGKGAHILNAKSVHGPVQGVHRAYTACKMVMYKM